jgi:hypothetical protein
MRRDTDPPLRARGQIEAHRHCARRGASTAVSFETGAQFAVLPRSRLRVEVVMEHISPNAGRCRALEGALPMQVRKGASAVQGLNLPLEADRVTGPLEALGQCARPTGRRAREGHVGAKVEGPVGMERIGDRVGLGARQNSGVVERLDLRDDAVAVCRSTRDRHRRRCRGKPACARRWRSRPSRLS